MVPRFPPPVLWSRVFQSRVFSRPVSGSWPIWLQHIGYKQLHGYSLQAYNTASRILGMIRRTISYKNKDIMLNLYKTLVRQHLEFCAPVCRVVSIKFSYLAAAGRLVVGIDGCRHAIHCQICFE